HLEPIVKQFVLHSDSIGLNRNFYLNKRRAYILSFVNAVFDCFLCAICSDYICMHECCKSSAGWRVVYLIMSLPIILGLRVNQGWCIKPIVAMPLLHKF